MNVLLRALWCLGLAIGVPLTVFAQQPVANFSANVTSGCSPIVVQFTDLSTNNPTSWIWDLGNGTTSTLQNPSTTYITPGLYTVTLTATNASGSNTKTVSGYINVTAAPSVQFTANDSTAACPPKTIQFTNLSTPGVGGAASYSWDFGDGTTSNLQNPSHTYTGTGNFTVTLVVTNSAGCVKALTKTGYIPMTAKPVSGFSATNTGSCNAPLTTTFVNNTTGAVSYEWDFGDGSTSTAAGPSHTYTAPGSYTVRLISTNAAGCKDTVTRFAFISIGNLDASFSASAATACTGNPITFTNTTVPGPGNSTWYFGDGGTATSANASHAYAAPGTYTVKLVVQYNNCSDSATQTVTINPGPQVAFSASPTSACSVPFTTQFTNTTTNAVSYQWDFGDGGTSTAAAPSHTYTALGTYTVRLIATSANGCKDTLIIPNMISIAAPTVSIYPSPGNNGCAPMLITFSQSVNSPLSPVVSYQWNFGDGGTATGPNPSHTYTTPGSYTASLTITTASGCTATAAYSIGIGTKPNASFTAAPTQICTGQSVQFTNTSTGGSAYTWYFGDGGTSNATNPSYVYNQPGTYTVTLIANSSGCLDTAVITNLVTVTGPTANFTHVFNCASKLTHTFNNTSSGATSYSWNFGDGNTSTAASPTHTYAAYGVYTVTLTASDGVCTSVKQITLNLVNPSAAFSTPDTTICKGQSVTFNTTSTTGINSYTWSFGDNTGSSAGAPISKTYNVPGIYTVKLTITDINGCVDSMVKPAYMHVGGPTVNFTGTPALGCVPLVVNFTSTTTGNGGFVVTGLTWNFGDGSSLGGNNSTPSHTYTANGTYSVTLIATDANGCVDSFKRTNYINATEPQAQFQSADTNACPGQTVSFSNTSTGGATYAWTFGDGGTSTAVSPTHIYTASGNYTVRLIVTSASGCTDTLIRSNYIHVTNIVAGFVASDTFSNCPPLAVNFTNTTTGASTYAWTFGNGATSTLTNPSTVYTMPGVYSVKLKAQNAAGCKDSVTKTITVLGPTGTFSYTPANGCTPMTVTFTATTQNTTSLIWDMNDGVTQTTTSNTFTYTFSQGGVFVPKLILSNGQGCNVAIQGMDTIRAGKVTSGFTFSPNNLCQAGTVQFTDTSSSQGSSINTYSWTFGDGGTSTSQSPTHYYGGPGTYTVTQIVGNSLGCKDTTVHQVTIHPNPVLITSGAQTICNGGTAQLSVSGASSYLWSPAGTLSCTTCSNPVATPTTSTVYTVTGSNAFGCSDTEQVAVSMYTPPAVSAGNNQAICSGSSVNLQATGATTYSWTPATGLSCTNCTNPTATPTVTTTYTVTGTDANGCADTGTVTITVNPAPNLNPGTNQNVCNGASVQLQATGATTYSWTPATGLSCTNCANPVANPATTTTYTVTGSNGTCTATGQVTVTVTSQPVITAGANQNICVGGSAQLQAGGAVSYSWTPSTGLSCTNCANPVASPTTTTTYTVTGTAAGGCSGTAQVTVNIVAPPVVTAGSNQAICSGGSVQLQAGGATTYSWTPATGLSCTNCANPTATPLATTTYTVTGATSGGCSNTSQVTVTVNPLPAVSGGPNQSVCTGAGIALNATGATNYSWTPSTGLSCTNCASPTATPSATTVYTVTGTDGNGCSNSGQVTVSVNPLPVITSGSNQTICAGSSVSLQAGGGTSYSWSPATGLSCTNCANPTASPATTTTYTVTGTDANGCSNTSQVTVTVNPLPVANAGTNQSICAGSLVQLIGTGGATYSWSPSTGLSCTSCSNPIANPTTTTTYTLTVTNTNGCIDTAQVTVTVNPLPVISANAPSSVCPGASTQLQASGGSSYSWAPATGLSCTNCANPTATPAVTTTYTVTGTGANGCSATAQTTVTLYPAPAISAGPDVSVCSGNPANLQASGGTSYSWTPATGLSCTTCANPTATPSATTVYTVTATDANGCTGSDQVQVGIGQLPTISAGTNQSICSGSSIPLLASGGATYSWTPATGLSCSNCANPTAAPATTTTYTVTGTNAQGCSNTAQVTVTVNPLPVISANAPSSVCPGTSTQLQASGGTSYSWAPATGLSCTNCANPTATPAVTTTYTVTGTGANGCSATAQTTVTLFPAPAISAGPDVSVCSGNPANLQASGGVSYSWSPATGLSCTNCANPTATPSATTVYTVTATDANGCTGSDQVQVGIGQLPTISAGADQSVCSGSSIPLLASGGATYSWTPATGLSCSNCASPNAAPTTTTTYTVTGTNAQGCSGTDQVTITVKPAPPVNAGADQSICTGAGASLNATGATTYSWTPATGLSCSNCANPTATPTGTTMYTLTGTDAQGCSASDQVQVTVNPLPTVNAGADREICKGATTQLIANGAVSYSWTPAATLSCSSCPNPVANPTVLTTYTVTGIDANGCSNSDEVVISIVPEVPTFTGPGDTLCKGESAQLSASGGISYEWTPAVGLSNPHSPSPTATPEITTTYTVYIRENQCYTDTALVTVVVNPTPTVNAGTDQQIVAGGSANIFAIATDADQYTWTPPTDLSCVNCLTPVATPKKTTVYTIEVSNEYGCRATDDIVIDVYCDNSQLFMPNTFTPNGDGQNDRFYPRGKGVGNVGRFRIYNRWGEVMYDVSNFPANEMVHGWDGTFKGQPLKPDVYVWILEAQCDSGSPMIMKGDISLIR